MEGGYTGVSLPFSLQEEAPLVGIPSAMEMLYQLGPPLKGLKVVIIHVKDKLRDGPSAGETILKELLAHEEEARFPREQFRLLGRSGLLGLPYPEQWGGGGLS